MQVVKDLIANFNIIACTDSQGNTVLHVAAYRGYLAVVEVLILASPTLTTVPNNYGDTFLHMAVAGFRAPGFRRLDRQIELMKKLLCDSIVNIEDIINVRNNAGRTALHMAVSENIHINLVELLMTVPSINLNIRDAYGMTPLDHLKQRPQSATSEILIKQLISAGGISNCQDHRTRSALVSHLKTHGIGTSPGTSFRIPDAEIFLYTGIENANSDASCDHAQFSEYSGDPSQFEPNNSSGNNNNNNKKSNSANNSAKRLKFFLRWPRKKDKKPNREELRDDDSLDSLSRYKNFEDNPIPLRQIYSKSSSLPNNRRLYSDESFPSPSTKMRFAAGLMHGVIKTMPHLTGASADYSGSSTNSGSSMSSPEYMDKQKSLNITGTSCTNRKESDMNEYFSFGAQGLAPVEDSMSCTGKQHHSYTHYSSLVA